MQQPFDVLVIGAGFSGLHSLHKLRDELGLRVAVLEKAPDIGGVWYYNRYPGARCDIESIEYSYSFSDEIQQEWVWTEVLPGQPEIEAYLHFVADRLDLRKDIRFESNVTSMTFDEETAQWVVRTDDGDSFVAPFVVAATGILSVPLEPQIDGMASFEGASLFTSRFPHDGFDFSGKRVGLVGTGSTGIQVAPVIAEQAEQLLVFQRSAAYTLPSNARAYAPGELDELKARYAEIRAAQKDSFIGAARLSAFSVLIEMASKPPLLTATREERLRAIEEDGILGALHWGDVLFDMEANEQARQLYGEAIARIVHDPDTAAALVPHYPFGCKRPIIDQGYYPTFNRPNVTLVDLRKDPLVSVTPRGICTEGCEFDLDVILYATGFDAMTGALTRIDVRGRDGLLLRDLWQSEGAVSFMGVQVNGFPNLFTIQGPGSPAAASNYVAGLEDHVKWIADCIRWMRSRDHRTIEVSEEAQEGWGEHALSMVEGRVFLDPSCHSWYNGGNVPGKPRRYLGYVGGVTAFRTALDEAAASGYAAFEVN